MRHPITNIDINSNSSEEVGPKSDSRPDTKILITPSELIIKKEMVFTCIPGIRPVIMPKQMPKKVNKKANRSSVKDVI